MDKLSDGFGKKHLITAAVCSLLWMMACAGYRTEDFPPYRNPNLSIERRVEDLVSRMTLEEKISQMRYDAPAIEHLGIPEYNWWNECLHGVARAGRATVFPQAIGLAAAWDTDLMNGVAEAISDEARAKHHEFDRNGKRGIYQGLTFWSPNINLFRDPRWGRGMETYGEDPYLAGQMGISFIKGLQGDDPKYLKTVATVKHYAVHSGPEPDRHSFDARIDERDLHAYYLPHFRACIREGGAYSVMCAYNRYMGAPCCGSSLLLNDILRKEWNFDGYVVSDCWAIMDFYQRHKVVSTAEEAGALALKSGTDLNCGVVYQKLLSAVEQGFLIEEDINVSVKRLFKARFKLGMFDPPDRVPYAHIPYSVNDCQNHRELALEAARKSLVLLKNENDLLPLRKDIASIAVIGPNADDVEVLLGNYNGFPSDPITPLRGIREKVASATRVLYAQGCELAEHFPLLQVIPAVVLTSYVDGRKVNGLLGAYFDNRELEGEPLFTRVDKEINFQWWESAPDSSMDDDNFGVRWTGELVPPVTGEYQIGGYGQTGFHIFLNDSLFIQFESAHHPVKRTAPVVLETQKPVPIRIEFFEKQGDAQIQLLWSVPDPDLEKRAEEAAVQSDVVITIMGLSPRLEGEEMRVEVEGFEGGDRLNCDLPAAQRNLLQKIQSLGKPVVLILLNGSALSVNWADVAIPAILEAWYPGQAAGRAIADVLFGDVNPAGRLPVTFYKSVNQLPPFEDYSLAGRTYLYFGGDPLYPFGYGLSYTRFAYRNLRLPHTVQPDETVAVSVDVENIGDRPGEEVVQLYVSDVAASVPVPIRSLQGFRRIALKPGETRTVRFTLTPRQFSLVDWKGNRFVEAGSFEVIVGGKQPGFSGSADAATTGTINGSFQVHRNGKTLPR